MAGTRRNSSGDSRRKRVRFGIIIARRSTTDALNASLEQMRVVEDMRRTLREIRDVNKLDSN